MTEQAPVGGLGGEATVRPYKRNLIKVIVSEDGEYTRALAHYMNKHLSNEAAIQQTVSAEVSALLRAFDLEPANWSERITGMTRTNSRTAKSAARLQAELEGEGTDIGDFLFRAAFMDMPMESDNDGHGGVCLALRLDDELQVALTAQGEYWRDRFYRDPESDTGIVSERYNPGRLSQLWQAGEPEYLGYDDDMSLQFTARVTQLLPAAEPSPV